MVAHQLKSFCSFFKCKKSLEATDKIEKIAFEKHTKIREMPFCQMKTYHSLNRCPKLVSYAKQTGDSSVRHLLLNKF